MTTYKKAKEINDNQVIYYNNSGIVYERQKNFNNAKEYYEKGFVVNASFLFEKNILEKLLYKQNSLVEEFDYIIKK